jgi:GntR family transcriptional regulator, transcriptional repressor for pyruvate dehydrogenase complex
MPLQRKSLTSQAFDYILDLIKSGKVKPGEKLPTGQALIETLGISRTCVREAMKSLESLDLITVRPKIGAVVKQPSPSALFRAEHLSTAAHNHQTDLLIEFRKILEVGLVSLAAEKWEPSDLQALESAIEEHHRCVSAGEPAYQADLAFHSALASASRNPFAIMVFESILDPLTDQRSKTNAIANAAEDGLRDHRKILDAVKKRNCKRARELMRAHMDTAAYYWELAKAQFADGKNEVTRPQTKKNATA